ncbi:MAG: branched-chain amino acid ABC transporter permease [Gammaproteobacteria bacterium]
MAELFSFALLQGLFNGLMLFLLASGLTLIFSLLGVLNLAHASFYMLGAYFSYAIGVHTGFWGGVVIAPLLVGCGGALVERLALRHLHRVGHVAELVFTFGLALLIEEGVQLVWGRAALPYHEPEALRAPLLILAGLGFPTYKALLLAAALAIFVALALLLTYTRLGLIVQAALSHPEMVAALGHDVPTVFTLVFGLGTGLAGLAGALAGPVLGTYPGMAVTLGATVFVVVVIGGLGSLTGALVAALAVGFLQSGAIVWDITLADVLRWFGWYLNAESGSRDRWDVALPRLAPLLPYLLMIVVLIVRPSGLFGKRAA